MVGIGHEPDRDRHGENDEETPHQITAGPAAILVAVSRGDRRLGAGGFTSVEAQCAGAELSGVTLTAPGHRDHEADGKHPGRDPNREPDQEAEHGTQAPVGVLVALVCPGRR